MRHPSLSSSTFITDIFEIWLRGALIGNAGLGTLHSSRIASADLIPLCSQGKSKKDSKSEPGGGGDKQENGQRHYDRREKHVRGDRIPILDNNDRYQNRQQRGGNEFEVAHKVKGLLSRRFHLGEPPAFELSDCRSP